MLETEHALLVLVDLQVKLARVIHERDDVIENARKLIERVGRDELPEMFRICHDNAGFSAITQLEYGVRRAIQEGNVPQTLPITDIDRERNELIIQKIQDGIERFPDVPEESYVTDFIDAVTPKLFVLYEKILNGACRDRNTADAWNNPEKWRVPGSLEFIEYLHQLGCINYFVLLKVSN